MTFVPVSDYKHYDDFGRVTSIDPGFAESHGYIAHHVRQALGELEVPIDANDRFDDSIVDRDAFKVAYSHYAKPAPVQEGA